MKIDMDAIRELRPAEKLRLIEQIWDDLAADESQFPLPNWALAEATRRRDEMTTDSQLGLTHEEIWKNINDVRNG